MTPIMRLKTNDQRPFFEDLGFGASFKFDLGGDRGDFFALGEGEGLGDGFPERGLGGEVERERGKGFGDSEC